MIVKKDHDIETLTFYVQLLMEMKELEKYPFIKMLIAKGVTEKEYQELIMLLSNISEEFEAQKEAGMLDFTGLLIHYAGKLNPKLHPDELMDALIAENRFLEVMIQLKKIRQREDYF
ncbi:DUF1878 family protein [Pontibacillus marinus]|uniref:DUF1878 domain-containing protein n=1 Tax=Pontibacillus marinus BH030004 = DSM 16465 TaxID=1385511 RepID=A0A0A5HRA7_9BACI|nr:DUF1878 family protein [Pontibacillus marinus]KGX86167.1 hypothetical protein N783_12670 [Pontibacillus marinus BH030004 = DSM 16465]